MAPCSNPMAAPTARPTARAMTQMSGWSKPKYFGRNSACVTPMIMPTRPRMEPTERSIWRATITSTMPAAMTATDAVCTERFHRLRGVRKAPPDRRSTPIQISASAPSMPTKRASISVARNRSARPRRWDAAMRSDAPESDEFTSVAGLGRSRLHAAADHVLGHPAGLDDDVEVVPGDRHRRQQDRGHRDLARAVGPALGALQRRELGALGERHRLLARRP